MKAYNFQKIILFALIFGFYSPLFSQCPTSSLTLTTQQEIDDFATNYPGCTEIDVTFQLQGTDITNLNGLSVIERVNDNNALVIWGTSISSFAGLDATYISEIFIFGNNNITSLAGLENLESTKQLWMSGNESITSLNGITSLTSISRRLKSLAIHCLLI